LAEITDIFKALEELAPPELAEHWDNCGLQVGRADGKVSRILLSLDVTLAVAEEAVETKAELIVSHHPLIFSPLRRIDESTVLGKIIYRLVSGRTTVFSAHTSLDAARGGVNDALAGIMGIKNSSPLKPLSGEAGHGRIGELSNPESGTSLARRLKSHLGIPEIRFCGDISPVMRRVAVCSGSGGELIGEALERKAELFVTGEIRHHAALEALSCGLPVLELGHWKSEHVILEPLRKFLLERFTDVQATISSRDEEPFRFI
jgi:dinuclear metal center YbgI/SA1388 family protein